MLQITNKRLKKEEKNIYTFMIAIIYVKNAKEIGKKERQYRIVSTKNITKYWMLKESVGNVNKIKD